MIIFVSAQRNVREKRLDERSPDIPEAERKVRLDDLGPELESMGLKFETINTTELTAIEGQKALQQIVDKILNH